MNAEKGQALANKSENSRGLELEQKARLRPGLVVFNTASNGSDNGGIVLFARDDVVVYETVDGGTGFDSVRDLNVPLAGSVLDLVADDIAALMTKHDPELQPGVAATVANRGPSIAVGDIVVSRDNDDSTGEVVWINPEGTHAAIVDFENGFASGHNIDDKLQVIRPRFATAAPTPAV